MSAVSYKRLFSRALAAAPQRLHFAAHSHHLWPDASYDGHLAAWNDAALLADRKWDKVFGEIVPNAQAHIARELALPDPRTIAFGANTHELLLRVFSARERKRPLDVLTTDGEFHSFRRQAARWEEHGRLLQRIVPCAPYETFTKRYLAAVKERTPDIAFLSHVMFKTGLRFDGIDELAQHASPDGMWAIVDLYHSFMAMPLDVSRAADRFFFLGGGYKYAMAGEGCAYLHAPPGFALRPANTGWFADFGAMEAKQSGVAYAPDGMRFMGATFDPTGLYRFNAVRDMLGRERLSTSAISNHIAPIRAALETAIANGACGPLREAELLKPNADGPKARFMSLRDARASQWKTALAAQDIVTDARDDVLRIGLGLYHEEADVAPFCAAVKAALS